MKRRRLEITALLDEDVIPITLTAFPRSFKSKFLYTTNLGAFYFYIPRIRSY